MFAIGSSDLVGGTFAGISLTPVTVREILGLWTNSGETARGMLAGWSRIKVKNETRSAP